MKGCLSVFLVWFFACLYISMSVFLFLFVLSLFPNFSIVSQSVHLFLSVMTLCQTSCFLIVCLSFRFYLSVSLCLPVAVTGSLHCAFSFQVLLFSSSFPPPSFPIPPFLFLFSAHFVSLSVTLSLPACLLVCLLSVSDQ